MARLWSWLIRALDPDRIYKVFGYVSLIVVFLLLLAALSGASVMTWRQLR